MKIKRVIYLGLATLLTLSSLTVPVTVLAAGTDNSSSSSQNSSTGSSSSTSSVPSSSSSSANTDSSSTNQATKTTVVVPQDDPPAPTKADGVQNADWNGSFFIIPIITGFQVQPQSEQYVVANSSGTGVADLGFKASFVAGALEKIALSQTIWSWDGAAWTSKTTTSSKPGGGLLDGYILNGNPTVDNTVTFPLGTYYVQYVGKFHGWLDLPTFHSDKKISKLVKVVVVDAPVQAKSISITVPNVIFANAAYEGDAVTDPVNATGKISWTGGLTSVADWDGLTWNQKTGRNSNYMVDNDKQPADVNRDTSIPGTPILLAANIDNATGAGGVANDTKTTYLGGLVANKMAADEGGTWSLDTAGLKDLEASVNPASGDNVTWDYRWQYSTDGTGNDISFRNITSSDDGVSNYKGTVSSAEELSSSSNALTFSKNSGFVALAAAATASGKDYVVREVLTANVPDQSSDGSGKDQTIEINSNAASLTVAGATGKLSLDSVPDFNFSNITATDIYNGVSGTKSSDKSNLTVTDTRSAASKNWSLSTKMTRMTDENGNKLNNNITISDINVDPAFQVSDDDKTHTSLSKSAGGTIDTDVIGDLYSIADHKMQLTADDHFSGDITWNLTSTTPSATALK